jgi:hypothetical protein
VSWMLQSFSDMYINALQGPGAAGKSSGELLGARFGAVLVLFWGPVHICDKTVFGVQEMDLRSREQG